MITLAVLLALEIVLFIGGGPIGSAGLGLLLLGLGVALCMAGLCDQALGYYNRLAYALSAIWYVGSLYRWLPLIDSAGYSADLGPGGGALLILAILYLFLVPAFLLGLPALAPAVGAYRGLRNRLG